MKKNNSSREEILKRIKTVRTGRSSFRSFDTDNTEEIYKPILPDAITCFKNELESINGQCVICKDKDDLFIELKKLVDQREFPFIFCRDKELKATLDNHAIRTSDDEKDFEMMQAGITGCEYLIARTGSVMVSSASQSGRQMNIFPPVHLVIASASQMVNYPEDALNAIQKKYNSDLPSSITTITGPSRTADIEKTLVLGAHGPKEIIVFLVQE